MVWTFSFSSDPLLSSKRNPKTKKNIFFEEIEKYILRENVDEPAKDDETNVSLSGNIFWKNPVLKMEIN